MNLLWALAAIFLVLWLLGFSLQVSAGGLIHVLLVLAVVTVLVRLVLGRRVA